MFCQLFLPNPNNSLYLPFYHSCLRHYLLLASPRQWSNSWCSTTHSPHVIHLKMSIRSCHFTLKTHSLYCSCKVLLHLVFALLQLCFIRLPLWPVLLSRSGIFLFSGLTGMFLQFGAFPHAVASSQPALSRLFTWQVPSHPSLLASNAALSEGLFPDYPV